MKTLLTLIAVLSLHTAFAGERKFNAEWCNTIDTEKTELSNDEIKNVCVGYIVHEGDIMVKAVKIDFKTGESELLLELGRWERISGSVILRQMTDEKSQKMTDVYFDDSYSATGDEYHAAYGRTASGLAFSVFAPTNP